MSTFLSRMAILSLSLALAAAAHAGTFQRQVAADPNGEVDVSNISGSIVITGWDEPMVAVSADLSGDAQRVKVTSQPGRTRVCVTYGSDSCDSGGFGFGEAGPVDLELHVPRQSKIRASAVSRAHYLPRRHRRPTPAHGER